MCFVVVGQEEKKRMRYTTPMHNILIARNHRPLTLKLYDVNGQLGIWPRSIHRLLTHSRLIHLGKKCTGHRLSGKFRSFGGVGLSEGLTSCP